MLRESHTAVVARNELWAGAAATEPYEAGWASEAIFFVRALEAPKRPAPARPHRDLARRHALGRRRHASSTLPAAADAVTFARVSHFGDWLRIVAELPEGSAVTVLVSLHLKA